MDREILLRNLADVARNSVRAGAVRLVLAVVRDRLLRRHRVDDVGLKWHLHCAPELDAVLHAAALEDHCLDVTTASPAEAAVEVARRIGW